MNWKKALVLIAFVPATVAIVVKIDHLIGIDFKDASELARVAHTVIYMLWGIVLFKAREWATRKHLHYSQHP
jgi:hypothetical protein